MVYGVSFFDDDPARGAAVDVEAMFDGPAADALWQCVTAGALVSVGTSRDGGALSVGVTCGGKLKREWFRDADELKDWLTRAAEAVVALDARGGPGQRPTRGR